MGERLRPYEKEPMMLLAAASMLIDTKLRQGLGKRAEAVGAGALLDEVLAKMDELTLRLIVSIPEKERHTMLTNLRGARISLGVAQVAETRLAGNGMYVDISDWELMANEARSVCCLGCKRRGSQCRACKLRKALDRNILTELPEIDGCPYREGIIEVERERSGET